MLLGLSIRFDELYMHVYAHLLYIHVTVVLTSTPCSSMVQLMVEESTSVQSPLSHSDTLATRAMAHE